MMRKGKKEYKKNRIDDYKIKGMINYDKHLNERS